MSDSFTSINSDPLMNRDTIVKELIVSYYERMSAVGSISRWAEGSPYLENWSVYHEGDVYHCQENHTSGVFATDLADGKWKRADDVIGEAVQGLTWLDTLPDGEIVKWPALQTMQSWIAGAFGSFVKDLNEAYNPDSTSFSSGLTTYDTWQEFCEAADLVFTVDGSPQYGFRRAVEWEPSTGDWETDPTFLEIPVYERGRAQVGDILGPWIVADLQKAFTALKWTAHDTIAADPTTCTAMLKKHNTENGNTLEACADVRSRYLGNWPGSWDDEEDYARYYRMFRWGRFWGFSGGPNGEPHYSYEWEGERDICTCNYDFSSYQASGNAADVAAYVQFSASYVSEWRDPDPDHKIDAFMSSWDTGKRYFYGSKAGVTDGIADPPNTLVSGDDDDPIPKSVEIACSDVTPSNPDEKYWGKFSYLSIQLINMDYLFKWQFSYSGTSY